MSFFPLLPLFCLLFVLSSYDLFLFYLILYYYCYYYYLDACLGSRSIDLGSYRSGEGLDGVREGETIIRIFS